MRWLNRSSQPFPHLEPRDERKASLADHHCPYREKLESIIVTVGGDPLRLRSAAEILRMIGAESFIRQDLDDEADPVTGCAPVTADGGQLRGE